MATGLLASVFGVLRLCILLGGFEDREVAWMQVKTDLLCGLEMMVAIIAASLPCLKAPTQRLLYRFSVIHSSPTIDSHRCFEQVTLDSHIRHQIEELCPEHFSGRQRL